MHEAPLVSILVNNYNYGRDFLVRQLTAPSSPNLREYRSAVVVDDGSTDNSADAYRHVRRSYPLHSQRERRLTVVCLQCWVSGQLKVR